MQVINSDPEILGGTPVFNGTRVPIKNLFDYLETGETIAEFLDDFPSVTLKQVLFITDIEEIKRSLEIAVREIYRNDYHLLKEGLNERAITTRLFCYLRPFFLNHDVDHEYNGNIENARNRRKDMVGSELEFEPFRTIRKPKIIDGKAVINISPDIIVHKRGSNSKNILIIEVKKTEQFNRLNLHDKFDITKICYFTSLLNGFVFTLGVFLQIGVKQFCLRYFVEGVEIMIWKKTESVFY
ncbi:DUF433 domain-containing protein [Hymenobacter nivis]|uniref:DUF433 domain-containing protein n=1 Tax=Hymenobacter nivis TaxID=1850093 RepID=A0A2Z3GIV2_9BACT|nr:DUF433 domain-containing protein [Hymenobacter nivis]AWM32161.1 hypothetical protein DDQ68_04735 [Hymenobacter nivis]